MTCVIYILFYNNESKKLALSDFEQIKYTHLHFVKSSEILENIMYLQDLQTLQMEWINKKYVGCLSYRILRKHPYCRNILKNIDNIISLQYDVISITTLRMKFIRHATMCHPLFLKIWIKLLTILGYSIDQIKKDDDLTNIIVCNSWLATPEWMQRYITFIRRAIHVMNTNSELKRLLYQNSYYQGTMSKERLLQIFGKPYYTYHPFILERLPTFFFVRSGARIYYL